MPPDPTDDSRVAGIYARRRAALLSPELGEEAQTFLRDAADTAGDPGLVPELAALVGAYARERAADPPTRGQLHHQLRDLARQTARLRRAVTAGPWRRTAMQDVRKPMRLDFAHLDLLLGDLERRARMSALEHDPGDRTSADRSSVSPRWRLLWALADLWADRGGHVGKVPKSRFAAFASDVFAAAGEEVADRELREVADRWQAAMVTPEPRKSALASSER